MGSAGLGDAASKEIFVYSGLIDLLEKEEPLIAAVMAHEISRS